MSEIKYPKLLWMDNRADDSDGYTFALNAVSVNEENKGFISNEKGNTKVITTGRLGVEYIPIGFIPLIENSGILFSVREDEVKSEIGLVTNSSYTTLINSSYLGFTLSEQVQGTVTTVNGCENVVVFRAPKLWAINIDNLTQYLFPGYTETTANDDGEGWDVSLMKLFFDYNRPTFGAISINDTGGNLPLGTYQIAGNYLDSDFNETSWMDISLPIPIVDEALTAPFNTIDGGLNSVVPPTNKSISVSFNNIDTSFSYLRIALIASNDGVRTAYKIIDYPITSEELNYTITSISGDEITTIPVSEITVDRIIYDSCQSLTQIRGRLVPANVKEKNVDFSKFQQKANDIKTHWFCKELNPEVTESSSKSTGTYLDYRSYMSDEVYSLGIVYLFNDGYETPVFHIPGREADSGYLGNTLPEVTEPNIWHNRPLPQGSWDTTNLFSTVDIPYDDLEHILSTPFEDIGYGPGLVPRWKAVNTAIRFETPAEGYFAEGEMAYWESELDYPSTVDCSNTRIYPEGKIRHHKLPDNILVPHAVHYPLLDTSVNTWRVYPLGIKFTSIEYPAEYADEIIGYKIVREQRNKSNTSVHDKGLLTTCLVNYAEQHLVQPFPYNNQRPSTPTAGIVEPKHVTFHSPLVKFTRNSIGASHLKMEQKLISAPFTGGEFIDMLSSGPVEYRSTARFSVSDSNSAFVPTDVLNRKIRNQGYLDADSVLENYFDYTFNNTEQQEAYVISTVSDVPLPSALIDVFPYNEGLLDNLEVHFYYCGLNSYLPSQYGQISSGVYISCFSDYETSDSCEVYGGDVFISRLYFKKHAAFEDGVPVNDGVGTPDSIDSHLISFFAESTINCGLRHEGTEDSEVYYPKSYSADVDSFLDLERTVNGTIDSDLIPNYYAYNSDFSRENDVKLYFTLSQSYNYCSDCANEFKTRIPWSGIKNNETNLNPWRNFKANDYTDLPEDKGEITNVFVDDYKFYAQTLGALYNIPVGYQEIKTSETSAFLGTGEFMSLGGQELKSLKEGYLGSRAQWATCSTEIGTFIVSYDKVFLLTQGSLSEVSKLGLSNFFQNNKINFYDDFLNTVGFEYPFKDNPANPKGIGYISCRDGLNKRWILTKKDYKILFDYAGEVGDTKVHDEGKIYWNLNDEEFQICTVSGTTITGEFETIYFSDPTYFQNKSYTLSFDLDFSSWVSFHSYLPNFIFNTYNKWYSYKDSGIYEHNIGDFQRYYNDKYSYIVEQPVVQNYLQANVTNTIQFVTHASKYDNTYDVWKQVEDTTFNKIWLFNDFQSTGILNLVVADLNDPLSTVGYSAEDSLVYKAGKNWNLNSYFNYATAQPFHSKAWADIQDSYFIDKVPVNTSYLLSQTDLERFRDGYINCRFIYDDTEETRILFKYLKTYDIPSIR